MRTADERPEIKSVGNGLTFKRNLVGEADVRAGLYALADEVATRLRAHGLYAAAVQVLIKNPDLKSISRQKPLPWPSHLAREIGGAALELVKANWSLDAPIRMLTVTALNLTDGREGHQLSTAGAGASPDRKTGTAGTEPGRHPQKIRQDLHRPGQRHQKRYWPGGH